ncbi:hypothetical protein ABEG18_13940 [Alsobacter sp. KACC 23698]|uniref:Uncharacterized protein n=1 Tax=Alsobacter sp. KACC 23698 TaxID=3149229 RepID=A0AAU7J987_9HYPH
MQNCFTQWLEAVAAHCHDGQKTLVDADRLVLRDWFVDRMPPAEAAARLARCVGREDRPDDDGPAGQAVRPAA